ncbi:MAG: sulfatase [Akkermansiaceae bacterium]
MKHLLTLCSILLATLSSVAKKPNFIVIFCDDMGYADIGPFGAKGYETPNLDKMAGEGMVFTDFYSGHSFCTPSRASLMTGRFPRRLGLTRNFSPKSKDGLSTDETLIPEILRQAGYATAIYGKWHLGHQEKYLPTNRGFDEFYGIPYSNDMWPYHPTVKSFPDLPLYEGTKIMNPKVSPEDQKKLTGELSRRAVKFIEKNKAKPFFIYLPHPQPHVPLYAGKEYEGKTAQGLYSDVIREIDAGVGQIMKALEDNGIDDNTLVVFTSDNGPWLSYGNHGGSAKPLRNGKGTHFEGGYRVPCIMRWPAVIPSGKKNGEVCGAYDLLPTFAALASAPLPKKKLDGKDITALLKGTGESPHEAIFMGAGPHAVRSGKWKLILPHRTRRVSQPGKDGFPGKHESFNQPLALYNLQTDVSESNNIAETHPEVVTGLKKLLEDYKQETSNRSTAPKK